MESWKCPCSAQITQLLKAASKCGIGDSSVVWEVIEDYFCSPTSELDSNSEVSDSGTDSDAEPKSIRYAMMNNYKAYTYIHAYIRIAS